MYQVLNGTHQCPNHEAKIVRQRGAVLTANHN